ncbi:rhamnogalacturonan acetylesterase [Agromyces sp. NPDC049794]|uniref:rhamnogalacturonan acetylesterase n=1 Tax=unclassified Agromyces TaxID=2639701 RepID=UPI0033E67F2B
MIHLAGDSTVASGLPAERPMEGWGGCLGHHVDVPVVNHAIGGATTATFIDDGRWAALIEALEPGDTVVIQFGHNDQKHPGVLDAAGGYTERLERMLRDVRACRATPVLCTSVERRGFRSGRLAPSHGPYPAAVRALGRREAVPVIDLTGFTSWLYEWLGEAASVRLFTHLEPGEAPAWPDGLRDDTHFRDHGADAIAAYVAWALAGLADRDAHLTPHGRAGSVP